MLDIDYWHYRIKRLNDITTIEKRIFFYYESKCSEPDFAQSFIYMPLHYQPEAYLKKIKEKLISPIPSINYLHS